MNPQRELYTVKEHDTLWKIARDHNTTVEEIKKLNGIKDPHALHKGQQIALHKEAVGGFRVLLLDKERNPIRDLNYRLEVNGKKYSGKTNNSGETQRIVTDSPFDVIHICVQRIDGTWKKVAIVMSGFGDKLTVLVSGHVAVPTKTEKHPPIPPNTQPDTRARPKPKYGPDNPPKPDTKSDPGFQPTRTSTPDGKPVTTVDGDVPYLQDFLDEFNGEVMTNDDFLWAAKELGVEEAAIRAFAEVESAGGGFIKIGNRKVPKILYERHYFSRLTNHRFSAKYPDISLPAGYYVPKVKYVHATDADKDNKKQVGGPVPHDVDYYRPVRKNDSTETKASAVTVEELLKKGIATASNDKYVLGTTNYKRLIKAYQLDKEAALQSCSWGAFQIMGENWKKMGYQSPSAFSKAISRSEKEQIKAFVLYAKHVRPQLISYMKNHQWADAALAFNGPSYKQNNYDKQLEAAYKKYQGK